MITKYRWLLIIVTACSVVVLLLPEILSAPMIRQSQTQLAIAYFLSQWNGWMTLFLLAVGVFAASRLWNSRQGVWARTRTAMAVVLLAGCAIAARGNLAEAIFRPMAGAGSVAAAEAEHVADSDMVMGVQIGGEARAYPVLLVAYHHVINDEVNGQPLAATY